MAGFSVTLTNGTATKVGNMINNRNHDLWQGTFMATGSFSTATNITWYISPDNGVSLIPLKNNQGVAMVFAATNTMDRADIGKSNKLNAPLSIWAQMTGTVGTPNVVASVFDNAN